MEYMLIFQLLKWYPQNHLMILKPASTKKFQFLNPHPPCEKSGCCNLCYTFQSKKKGHSSIPFYGLLLHISDSSGSGLSLNAVKKTREW